jgi:hypothetical protein
MTKFNRQLMYLNNIWRKIAKYRCKPRLKNMFHFSFTNGHLHHIFSLICMMLFGTNCSEIWTIYRIQVYFSWPITTLVLLLLWNRFEHRKIYKWTNRCDGILIEEKLCFHIYVTKDSLWKVIIYYSVFLATCEFYWSKITSFTSLELDTSTWYYNHTEDVFQNYC